MTDKITLGSIATFQNDTSAVAQYNANNATLTSALDNTLSRDGTQPNQMGAALDMNSNRVINLPAPSSDFDAVRFIDIQNIGGGGSVTVSPLPTGGFSGQVLAKNSSANYDASWTNVVSGVNVTAGKTLSATNSLTLSGTDGTTITFPTTGGSLVTNNSSTAFTNKDFNTTGNTLEINGNPITGVIGSGNSVLLQNAPSINSPTITSGFTATNLVGNSALTQSPGVTIKGNPTNATANVSDFTINGLIASTNPDAANDYLIIWDHTAGTLKKINPTTIAGSNIAGVSSIASNTGAFTLGPGITNSTNIILSDASYHRGYISGCSLSNDSGTPNTIIDISAGVVCSDDQSTLMKTAAITKTTGSWTVGTGNGGLDTGSVAASTWYHIYIIERLDTSVVDALISTSATSPTLPTNYTVKRRIGSIKTDGSSHLLAFNQNGDEFLWAAVVQDISISTLSTSGTLQALASVPSGVKVNALLNVQISNASTAAAVVVASPDANSAGAGPTTAVAVSQVNSQGFSFPLNVRTNTSQQVRAVSSVASTSLSLSTYGWVDTRGRFA